jgi:hypothetical protein
MAKMKHIRDMVRVVTFGDEGGFKCYPPRELRHAQQEELKEKMAMLRMLDEHSRLLHVGYRFADGIFYVQLEGEPNAS